MKHEKMITVRMPPVLVSELEQLCEQRRVSMASAARWLLSSAIARERALAPRVDVPVDTRSLAEVR